MRSLTAVLEYVNTINKEWNNEIVQLVIDPEFSIPLVEQCRERSLVLESNSDFFIVQSMFGTWLRIHGTPSRVYTIGPGREITHAIYIKEHGQYCIVVGEFSKSGRRMDPLEVPPI